MVNNLLTNGGANGKSGGKNGTAPAGNDAVSANGAPVAGTAPGTKPAAPVVPAPASSKRSNVDGLGFAQYKNTILTVYSCTRQGSGTQVSCDTDLSNQDKTNTSFGTDTQWNDVYAIDDRGDRHDRSMGFFMNGDGEKRMNIDVSYGDSTRYVMVFNNVPAKATSLSLHSTNGGLDVEQIPITAAGSTAAEPMEAAAAPAGPAPSAASGAPAANQKHGH